MSHLLETAELYHAFQRLGGFFGARVKAFRDYLDFGGVRRIFDIGCGPGHIVEHVPEGIEYVGFDTDAGYIEFANRRFGRRGTFVAREFDRTAAQAYGRPDLILMNGVLHHMDDALVRTVVGDAAAVLSQGGVFFSLDGCYREGQNPVGRFLLDHDRGRFVRTAPEYRALVASAFPHPEVHVRDDLSWAPYTFAIVHARNPGGG
jgi:SAM-dependent methyltransferase